MLNTIRKIHFIGIGGSGMSGLAEVLLNLGAGVSGSDVSSTPITKRLQEIGVEVHLGHRKENLRSAEVVVVSSAIPEGNPEIQEARAHKIPIVHRSEILAELMRLKTGIAVAGTHGKTTTTSLLATTLCEIGLDPTVVIGGKLNSMGTSALLGQSKYLLAEADESDGSFLRLNPTVVVLTNIDKDHLDFYKTFENVFQAFVDFAGRVPFYGCLCACVDDPFVSKLIQNFSKRVITYGLSPEAHISAAEIRYNGFQSTFCPVINGKTLPSVKLSLPGGYNIQNALASYAVAIAFGCDPLRVSAALESFGGVQHRFTLIGERLNVTIVDDYAHNPTKIKTLLGGVRQSFPGTKVIGVFQPHRYTRIQACLKEFSEAFSDADELIITPVYSAGESPIAGADVHTLQQSICQNSFGNRQKAVTLASSLDSAADLASAHAFELSSSNKVLIVTMGAGDIQKLGPKILERLEKKA